ncbi:MAG: methylenetetrahydrofolate reductase [Candidatus Thorarchaeota archaeon]
MPETHLSRLLDNGDFVITAEIGLPRGSDRTIIDEKVKVVSDYCDLINVPDNPLGNPSMASPIASYFVLEAGAEPIMQICMRDRNRIAVQSSLYGAHALGIRNVLFVTGDSSEHGCYPDAKSVFDIDSVQALDLATLLAEGFNIEGEEIEGVPEFYTGATFNPFATPIDEHVLRTEEKVRAGARFFQTQCIFDVTPLERFLSTVDHLDLRVLAGVVPLQSPEMATFMNDNVPEVTVPEKYIKRLEDAADGLEPEEVLKATRPVGLEIALEIIEDLQRLDIQGLHIMGVGWEESVVEIVKRLGMHPRPKR